MKALIIGAGQGKRLLPLTEKLPKALLDIGGKSQFDWQVDHLVACGVDEIVFVGGFNMDAVRQAVAVANDHHPDCRITCLYNPFHAITDNLVSVWMARGQMDGDFLLLNSDTLFAVPVLETLLASPATSITVTIDVKERYDEDDMKVVLDGTRLVDIGKKIPLDTVNGESIGMLLFRGDGSRRLVAALENAMLDEASLKRWYLSVIAELAAETDVQTVSIQGREWCEIDYPRDLVEAKEMVARWQAMDLGNIPLSGTA